MAAATTRGSSSAAVPTVADENQALVAVVAESQPTPDGDEALPPAQNAPKEATIDRTELLRSKPEVVGRFLRLMVPILVDVYAASVITPVRIKTLTDLLKAVSFLDGDELKQVFNASRSLVRLLHIHLTMRSLFPWPASRPRSSSKDHPTLAIGALQLVELLLNKVPAEYKPVFCGDSVFHEIEELAARPVVSSKSKDKRHDKENVDAPSPAEPALPTRPPFRYLS